MTFFVPDGPVPAPRGPDLPPTPFLEGLGTAFNEAARAANNNFRITREVHGETNGLVDQVAPILGEQAMRDALTAKGVMLPSGLYDGASVSKLTQNNPAVQAIILDAARADALMNPGKYQGVDLSQDGIDRRVNDRLNAEAKANADVLSMMPSGRGWAELMGGIAASVADVRQLPLLVLGGGGGSLLKVLGREALIGAASEAVTLPGQAEMAQRSGTAQPNAVDQLAIAAAGGAILGGFGHALGRALEYVKGRAALPSGRIEAPHHEAAVSAAETAITQGDNPLPAVTEILQEAPLKPEPLIPDLPDAGAQFDAAVADTNAKAGITTAPVETQVIPPQAAPNETISTADLVQSADAAIKAAESNAAQPKPKKPGGSAPMSLRDFVAKQGVWKGDPLIGDLLALDYRRPGLVRKERFAQSAAGHNGGGKPLDTIRELATEAGYLREGSTIRDLLDALDKDIRAGKDMQARVYAMSDMADAQAWRGYQGDMAAFDRAMETGQEPPFVSPVEDAKAKTPAPGGLLYSEQDLNALEFAGHDPVAIVAADVRHFAAEQGQRLLPREVSEIADTIVRNRGGDAAFMVERAMERELSDAEHAFLRQTGEWPAGAAEPPAGFAGEGAGSSGRSEAAAGNAAQLGAGGQQPANLERTSAGQQYVAPGIAPITDRQRLEAQTAAPLDGGNKPTDFGLFDLTARTQADMFSDPGAAAARPSQMNMLTDLKDQVAKGETLAVDIEGEAHSLSDLVNEMEGDAEFEAVLDACRSGK